MTTPPTTTTKKKSETGKKNNAKDEDDVPAVAVLDKEDIELFKSYSGELVVHSRIASKH